MLFSLQKYVRCSFWTGCERNHIESFTHASHCVCVWTLSDVSLTLAIILSIQRETKWETNGFLYISLPSVLFSMCICCFLPVEKKRRSIPCLLMVMLLLVLLNVLFHMRLLFSHRLKQCTNTLNTFPHWGHRSNPFAFGFTVNQTTSCESAGNPSNLPSSVTFHSITYYIYKNRPTSAPNVPLGIHTLDNNRLGFRSWLSQVNGVHVLPRVLALESFQELVALGSSRDFPIGCNLAGGSEAGEFRGVLGDCPSAMLLLVP